MRVRLFLFWDWARSLELVRLRARARARSLELVALGTLAEEVLHSERVRRTSERVHLTGLRYPRSLRLMGLRYPRSLGHLRNP